MGFQKGHTRLNRPTQQRALDLVLRFREEAKQFNMMAAGSAKGGDYYAALNGTIMAKTLLYAADTMMKEFKVRLPLDDSA